ncbi:glutathione peroxidase [Echinicola shivajiensis]|uniref:glutathione peroxidase n=1 Tax=Echinicola shivajiensis TaxID=1035916 RepID=UPI001BFCC2CF|nr:glutathione peroxidase [Echinicola shivajiensis]
MKNFILMMAVAVLVACSAKSENSKSVESLTETNEQNAEKTFYDFTMTTLEGEKIDFSQYKGKKVLVVNVASKCGYTPQYEDLQKLNEEFGDKVVILGFPANNFGGQEPGTNEDIKKFCTSNYGVTFPMFEKISVKGVDKHPLYRWLSDKSLNGWNDQEPTWNFCKYFINEKGELKQFFQSKVNPMDDEIIKLIEA